MKIIQLTKGYETRVDDEDYDELVMLGRWNAQVNKNGKVYAQHGKTLMHRKLAKAPPGFDVDHDDGDSLNNQKHNLKVASRSQNMLNAANKMHGRNTSGIRGVYWDNYYQCWKAEIKVDKRKYTLGSYFTQEEAAAARKKAFLNYKEGKPVKEFLRRVKKPKLNLDDLLGPRNK